jgi:hypothetical protein
MYCSKRVPGELLQTGVDSYSFTRLNCTKVGFAHERCLDSLLNTTKTVSPAGVHAPAQHAARNGTESSEKENVRSGSESFVSERVKMFQQYLKEVGLDQ